MKQLIFLSVTGMVLASAAEGSVNIDSNFLEVRIGEDVADKDNGDFTTVPWDDPGVDLAVGTALHYSEIDLLYTESGTTTELRHDISQNRPDGGTVTVGGGVATTVSAVDTSMLFQVDENSLFDVTGQFNVVGGVSGLVILTATLYDAADNIVYRSSQQVLNGSGTYTIGGTEGTYTLIDPGSTYTLNADTDYRFEWAAATSSTLTNIQGVLADGFVTLALSEIESSVAEVPEPASLALWSVFGGIGIFSRRRRRQAAAAA